MQVLLIDDDPQYSEATAALLQGAGLSVECVQTAEAGLRRAGDPAVEVVILDRMLPGVDGTCLLRKMRAAGLEKPVLMLSALGRSEERVLGLDSGADDYLGKPYEPDELIARLRALLRRATVQGRQPVLFHGDIELHVRARTAHRAGRHLGLSPKEFDILKYLMENGGEIVTREMMLQHVWKLAFDPQTNVVDVSLVRLRRKLDNGFDTPCLETVRGRGYRLIAP